MATICYKIGKVRKDSARRVSFVLTCGNEKITLPGAVILYPSDFSRRGKLLSLEKRHEIDRIVSEYTDKLYKAEYDLMGEHSAKAIYSALTRPTTSNLEFFAFADEFIKKSKKYTYNFKCALRSLERYLHRRYLLFRDIDYNLLNDYCYNFLNGHPCAQSGYLGTIRRIYNEAMRTFNNVYEQPLPFSPFNTFHVPRQKARRRIRCVTVETLRKILNFHSAGRAELARDCYLLSFCLIGMNTADLYDKDARLVDGKICYRRKKTRTRRDDEAYIEIVVPEIIKPLLKRHGDRNRLFDFYHKYANDANFNKHVNTGLHAVAKSIGVQQFDFYSARHTWATIARNELGIDKYTINEALNHVDADMKIADVYIEKDFSQINLANRKVIEYVFGDDAYLLT